MAARWWHHDDRSNSSYDVGGVHGSAQHAAAPQQRAGGSTAPAQVAAAVPIQATASVQPAPGFGRSVVSGVKAALPKVWEYEDPLKDCHGPFSADQILNWLSQDWFGLDLKIRRVGNYWTQLEYVLEVRGRARARAPALGGPTRPTGCAAPRRATHARGHAGAEGRDAWRVPG